MWDMQVHLDDNLDMLLQIICLYYCRKSGGITMDGEFVTELCILQGHGIAKAGRDLRKCLA